MNFKKDSKYPMKLFVDNGLNFCWYSVKVGWDLQYLTSEEVSNFAIYYLEQHPNIVNKYISEIIFGIKNDEMETYLSDVLESLRLERIEKNSSIWNKEWRKWRYCIMKNIVQNSKNDAELLERIEEVYADFGYPEDMASFIYYVPVDEAAISLHNLNQNEARARLVQKVKDFILQEKIKIDQGIDTLPFKGIEY